MLISKNKKQEKKSGPNSLLNILTFNNKKLPLLILLIYNIILSFYWQICTTKYNLFFLNSEYDFCFLVKKKKEIYITFAFEHFNTERHFFYGNQYFILYTIFWLYILFILGGGPRPGVGVDAWFFNKILESKSL